jgi:hypothetical protein
MGHKRLYRTLYKRHASHQSRALGGKQSAEVHELALQFGPLFGAELLTLRELHQFHSGLT